MMLASTADNLFWMSRYVERAESIARTLDAAARMAAVPQLFGNESNEWETALATTACQSQFNETGATAKFEARKFKGPGISFDDMWAPRFRAK